MRRILDGIVLALMLMGGVAAEPFEDGVLARKVADYSPAFAQLKESGELTAQAAQPEHDPTANSESAHPQLPRASLKALLRQACSGEVVDGPSDAATGKPKLICKRARNYPNGRECTIEISDPPSSVVQGGFVRGASKILLFGYGSDCEPHANNWGGSLIFERSGASYVFAAYEPGLVFL